ncbi:MAG: Transglutaminase-like enzyme [Acidobacteria bacterium]|nr:Transglutaminase-like enzyme [Acidobacteriota bacterium]
MPCLARAAAYDDFDVRPAPSWVDHAVVDPARPVERADARFGMYALLADHQVRVGDPGTSEYFRRVRTVISASGVQHASELTFDFDPTYQRLVFHDVAVLRDGVRMEQLRPSDIRVIDKEEESDDRIYDGMLSAVLFLKDVRPGDVLDYSWSLEGANPILGGKYADEFELTSGIPARLIRHRLLWPAARTLHHRAGLPGLLPRIVSRGAELELTWERRNVAAVELEDETPDWFDPFPSVQLSEFASWNEVARWSDALFQVDAASAAAVKQLADRIRAAHPTQPERIVAAIRFVQDDVRYLGIEMGRNSHEPHQPSLTLEQRWGDCKDKAFLLAALLRDLGVEAYPALVNTTMRHELDRRLPSPFLFDHVIAQVVSGGRTYWIDGTIADQGGTLETIETPNDERALVVRKESTALARIDTNTNGSTLIEQSYTSTDYAKPTALQVRSTYSGSDADTMRARIASRSLADLAKEHLNRYATDQPKIVAVGPPVIRDDRTKNVIVLTERYTIRDLWSRGSWSYYPRAIEQHLHRPDTMIRSMPLAFDFPLNITQKLTFRLPEHLNVETGSRTIENGTFRYESNIDSNGDVVSMVHSLRALRDSVPVGEVPEHLTKLNDLWDDVGYSLGPGRDTSAAADLQRTFARVPGWLFGAIAVGLLVVVCVFLARPKRRAAVAVAHVHAPRRGVFGPGEAAMSALVVQNADEMEAHLATMDCPCGAAIGETADLQRARYDEREMTIASRRCGSCGREQSIYFSRTV